MIYHWLNLSTSISETPKHPLPQMSAINGNSKKLKNKKTDRTVGLNCCIELEQLSLVSKREDSHQDDAMERQKHKATQLQYS